MDSTVPGTGTLVLVPHGTSLENASGSLSTGTCKGAIQDYKIRTTCTRVEYLYKYPGCITFFGRRTQVQKSRIICPQMC